MDEYIQDVPRFQDDLYNVPVDWNAVFPDLTHQKPNNIPFGLLNVHENEGNSAASDLHLEEPALSKYTNSNTRDNLLTFPNLEDEAMNNSMLLPKQESTGDVAVDAEMQNAENYFDVSGFPVVVPPITPGDSPFNFTAIDEGDFLFDFSNNSNNSTSFKVHGAEAGREISGDSANGTGTEMQRGNLAVASAFDVAQRGPAAVAVSYPEPLPDQSALAGTDTWQSSLRLEDYELLEAGTTISEDADLFSIGKMKETENFMKTYAGKAENSYVDSTIFGTIENEQRLISTRKTKMRKPSPPKHCATCNTWIPNEQAYRNHRRTCHPLPKTEACEFCGAFYSAKCNLEKHKKSVHNTEKAHKCSAKGCDKSFAEQNKLKKHFTTVHCGHRDFACMQKECTKMFSQQSDLNRHLNLVHNNQKRYFCNTCEVEGAKCDFGRRSSLIQHLCRVHQMKQEVAGICSDEGKYINDKGKLITRAYPPSKPRKTKRPRKSKWKKRVNLPSSPVTDEEHVQGWL